MEIKEFISFCLKAVDGFAWDNWERFPQPNEKRGKGFYCYPGIGVYQVRNYKTKQLILVGIGNNVRARIRSLYPNPYGSGTRNNSCKKEFVFKNWAKLEYRILKTSDRLEAEFIEKIILLREQHLFNT